MANKKLRNVIIALSLVAVVGIGGTLAYLTATTDEKTNTFTMGTGITGELEEPEWDDGGKEDAENFVPGRVIAKDPQIENTSVEGTVAAHVAITLEYTGGIGSYEDLSKFAEIDWNTTDWTFKDDYTKAYSTNPLAAGDTSAPIFNTVTIKNNAITQAQIDDQTYDPGLYGKDENPADYVMKDFDIVLNGYLVQSEGFDDCQDAMQTAFPSVFN